VGSFSQASIAAGDAAKLDNVAANNGLGRERILVSIIVALAPCVFGALLLSGILLFDRFKESSTPSYDVESSSEYEVREGVVHRGDDIFLYHGTPIQDESQQRVGGSARPE
jgi:hypothetical protein